MEKEQFSCDFAITRDIAWINILKMGILDKIYWA